MRKTAIALAILIALVLAGLVLAPQFVDLNRFKGPIAAELTALTGRAVELRGPLGLSLLPGPTVTARDVRLANPPGAAVEDMVRLRAVEVKLAFWPLLARRIEIRSAALVEPDIDVERVAGGDGNWRFDRRSPSRAGAPDTTAMMRALAVDHLTIENGAVTYRAGNAVERFEHINATVAIEGGTGPYTASGEFVSRGAQLGFAARSGPLDAPEVPVEATLTVKPATRLQLGLVVTGVGDERRIEGQLKLTADNAQALAAMVLRTRLPAALARRLTLAADIRGTPRDLALAHLNLDFGTAHGEGSLHVTDGTPPTVALNLAVSQLDLDRWLAQSKAAGAPGPSLIGSAFAAPGDATGPVPLAPPQPDVPMLPDRLDASVDLGVKALIWRGSVVHDAQLKASLAHGTLTLDRAAAMLPGGSAASLSGSVAMAAEGPRGEGTFEANSDDLRGLLAWLGAPSGSVPADRLRKASLKSRLSLAGDRLDLAGIDATLDATRLRGAATVALRERPGIGLRLNADRFNLDAYLPRDDAAPPPADAGNPWPALLAAFDANIEAHIDTLTWHGELLGDAHAAGTLQNGRATIRDLSVGDIEGAAARLSGSVQGLGADPFAAQLSYEVHGAELERLLHVVSPRLDPGRAYGDFRLGGDLRWATETLSGAADLDILGGRARVAGSLAPASAHVALDIDIEHPSFVALMRSVSPSYRPAGADMGALKFTGQLTGGARHFTLDRVALDIGKSTAAGKLALDLDATRPHLSGELKLGDWAIDQFLTARQSAAIDRSLRHAGLRPGVVLAQAAVGAPAGPALWSREPIDLAPLSLADVDLTLAGNSVAYDRWRVDQPELTVAVKDGALALTSLAGHIFGGSIAAEGDVSAAAPPAVHAKLTLRDVDLKQAFTSEAGIANIDGRFDADASLASAGRSPAELIAGLSGEATLRGHDGAVSGVDLAAANEWLKVLDRPFDLLGLIRSGLGGRTSFSELTGSFHAADGIVRSDDIRLAADGTAGQGSATFDLPRWTMAGRLEFRLTGLPMAPPMAVQLEGPIDAPREVFDVNPLQRFLKQRQHAVGDQPVTGPAPER
ncbi:MAG TPA: AsmA family protein [Stellaceae bacterium]|nr:AsmA family protein [Stellaceae bacterium]